MAIITSLGNALYDIIRFYSIKYRDLYSLSTVIIIRKWSRPTNIHSADGEVQAEPDTHLSLAITHISLAVTHISPAVTHISLAQSEPSALQESKNLK